MNKPVFDKALISDAIQLDNVDSLGSAESVAEMTTGKAVVVAEEDEARRGSLLDVERAGQNGDRSEQAAPELGHDAVPATSEEEDAGHGSAPLVAAASLVTDSSIETAVAGTVQDVAVGSGDPARPHWETSALSDSTIVYAAGAADATVRSMSDGSEPSSAKGESSVILTDSALFADPSANSLAGPSTDPSAAPPPPPPASAGIFTGATTIDENPNLGKKLGTLSPQDDGFAHTFSTVSGQPFKVDYSNGTYNVIITDPAAFNYEAYADHKVSGLVKATTYDIETGASSSILQTLTFTLNDVSEPPIVGFNGALEVPENAVGYVIGQITINDVEGHDVGYDGIRISDPRFTWNKTANGKYQLVTANYAGGKSGIDYEASPDHTISVTVSVTNTAGHTGSQTFTFSILNGPEAPTGVTINGTNVATIPENSPGGTVVGTLQGQDPDSTSFTYTVLNNDPNFYADGNQLKVKPGAVLDYEAVTLYFVSIRVTDETGLSYDQSIIVKLSDVAEVNHDPDSLTFTNGSTIANINEELTGAVLGTLMGHDPDANDPASSLTYSIAPGGDPSGRYEVVKDANNNWILKLKDGVSLDYETTSPFHQLSVVVRVSDGHGGFKDQTFGINIADVSNDVPNRNPDSLTFIDGTVAASVNEEVTGATIGILKGHDPDSYDPAGVLKYSLSPGGDPSGRFEVVKDASGNPILKLKDGVSLDYESSGPNHSYTVVVRVSDGHGGFKDQAFTINVADVPNDPPNRNPDSLTFTDGTIAASVNEEVAGAIVGALMGHDPDSYDPANSLVYSIAPNGDPSGLFIVSNGLLKVKNGVSLDYETSGPNHQYTVVVRVSDGHGGLKDQAFTINVADTPNDPVNRNPDSLTFTDGTVMTTVNEEVVGAVVGTLVGHDPDSGDPASSLSYALAPSGDASGKFEVIADVNGNPILKLKDGMVLDYESSAPNHSYTVVVRVSDTHGGFKDQAFTINVADVPNDPANQNPDSLTFADGTVVASVKEEVTGATIGLLKGHDPDSNDPANSLFYSLAPNGDPTGKFVVVNNMLKLKDGVSLDYESSGPNHSYTVVVRVWDGHGGFKDQAFTINVADDPSDGSNHNPDSLTFTDGTVIGGVREESAGATIGELIGHDPDSYDPASSLIYSIAPNGDPSGRFEVVTSAGGSPMLKLKDGMVLDYESSAPNHQYLVTVRVSDGHGGFKDQIFTINVIDVPNDPTNHNPDSLTFADGTVATSVNEEVAGVTIGTLKGHDPDSNDPASSLIYALAPNGDPSGKFEVVKDASGNPILKLKDGVRLDYETSGPGHSYTVTVRVSDNHGGFKDQAFTIAVVDTPNDPPNHDPDSLTFSDGTTTASVDEEVTGATLGILKGHDVDVSDTLTYALAPNGDPSGRFEVVRDARGNPALKLKDGVSLDYESSGPNHSYTVVVRVSDGHGGFKDQAFTIGVTDVLNDPANRDPDSLTFADGTVAALVNEEVAGVTIGILKGHDPDSYDPANTLVYSLAPNGDPSGNFEVVKDASGNPVLKLKDGKVLDYETSGPNHQYSVVVRVSDGHGGIKDQVFTITVNDTQNDPVNSNPDSLTFIDGTTAASVVENVTGAPIGTLKGHDVDASDVLTYALAPNGDPSGRFEVVNGVLKLKDGVSLDYENSGPNHQYSVVVRVSDNHGGSFDQTFTIGVTDVPNDPVNHNPDSLTFTNHQTEIWSRPEIPGALVGVLIASDPDANDAGHLTFELVSDPDNLFVVSPDGIVKLQAGKSLSLFSDTTIVVRVWDGHGGFMTQQLTIHADGPSSDTPPVIHVNGATDFSINDVATVAPFQNLVFTDAEDDATNPATPITVLVRFLGQLNGDFENLPTNLPPGVEFTYVNGDSILVKGTHDQVTNILKQLQFNPHDGVSKMTDFTVIAFDSQDVPSQEVHVHVTSAATGGTNHSPTIEVDPNGTPLPPVYDTATTQPLKNLIFKDQDLNDTLTVTVKWTGADGAFDVSAAASFGVMIVQNDLTGNVLQVSGSQQNLTNFFKVLQFAPDDFPNDPYNAGHPITFSVDVQDQKGAHDTTEIETSVLTDNRAPDQVNLDAYYPDGISEDAGVGQEVGVLSGHDPNLNDNIISYRLASTADDRFTLVKVADQWAVVVNGVLDYESLPDAQKDPSGTKGWYEIQVIAMDDHGLESAPMSVKVWIQNVMPEPDNTAPVISVDANGQTSWEIRDDETVAAFHDLTFIDMEDHDSSAAITVVVMMDRVGDGLFELPPEGKYNVTPTYDSSGGVLQVVGLQEDVTAYLKEVVFNPYPGRGAKDSTWTMDFTVIVIDSDSAWAKKHVTVDTTVSGNIADNAAPTITVDPTKAETDTKDWDPPVSPFLGVTLKDTDSGNENLTLTISFDAADGSLNGLQNGGTRADTAGRVTWTFTGKLADLRTTLTLLTFDATEHDQAGNPITTQFTITLDDGHHAFPASNTDVKVVTTVTGPAGQNNLYYIVDGTETFHDEVPGPEGGFDIAYVKYTGGHYTLADNDGIEVLQAYDTNTAGIDVAGNNLSNTIVGSAFNDTLDGGSAGQDVLRGGKGDDTYVVARDGVIIEEDTTETGGIDTVNLTGDFFANGGYTLGQFLENLDASATTGVMTLNGNGLGNAITGNADHNILQGFDGEDTLDGGSGTAADVLDGGSGNDTYKIRHASDAIVEGAGDAFDVAEIYLHDEYRLKADAEVEVLRAGDGFTEGVHLVGNASSWIILGSGSVAVSDTLDGGTGVGIAHVLAGGDGNDTYFIVNVNDEIEGERDLADPNDDGKLHGGDDVAYLYRGLYATKEELQAKVDHYMARGIERVIVLNGVPEGPDNAAPTNVRLSNGGLEASVKENSSDGTGVAIVIADDDTPDTTGMTFEIFDNDAFGIDADTGEIYVLDKSKLDLEQQQSYTVHVRAKDAGGLYSAWQDVTITLSDENEAADSIAFSDLKNVAVGNDVGTLVAKATAHDPDIYTDAYRVNHYRFLNGTAISDDGFFEIDPDSGQIKVHNKLTDVGQYSLWIVAYDELNHVSQAFEYKVVVQDAGNQPPSNLHLTTGGTAFSVDENTDNTTFSHFITADDDKSGPLTYYIDANDLFVVDEQTGQISIRDGAKLDHETNATYTVTVYAKDGEGALSSGQQIQVTINDKNDGPDAVAVNHVADIKVGSGQSIVVAQAVAHDFDTDPLNLQNHFRFVDSDGWFGTTTRDGLFTINDNGEIVTARGILAADQFSHNLKVQAYDQDGHSVETTYTVDVGASDDPGPIPELIDNKTVLEHARNGTAVGKLLSVNAATGETFSYQLMTGQTEDRFMIDAQGILRVKDGLQLDFEQGRLATVKVMVTSSLHGTFEHDVTITLRNLGTEVVTGGSGNDKIVSGQLSDVLDGGAGNDTLISGLGDDQLTGGDGDDTFVFDQVTFDAFAGVDNVDTIMDFNVDHDHIELRQQAFDALDLGVLNVDVFHVGSLDTMTENSRIIYDQENGDLYYDLDGSGTDFASKKIATFMEDPDTGLRPVLSLSHFLVV